MWGQDGYMQSGALSRPDHHRSPGKDSSRTQASATSRGVQVLRGHEATGMSWGQEEAKLGRRSNHGARPT